MKKKIAILSLYYKNANYGAMLQAYALQQTVEKLGYTAEQISYELQSGYKYRVHTKIHLFLRKWINRLKYIQCEKEIKRLRNAIAQFAECIPHTKTVDCNTIKQLAKEYDGFICGSDQIWNPMGWQSVFFLDFVPDNKIKIAYAASIARNQLSEQEIAYMNQYVHGFTAVSVREEINRIQLNEAFPQMEISVQPDPVFLLSKDEWLKLVTPRSVMEPYIFAYFLGDNFKLREELIKYAEKTQRKIIFIPFLKEYSYKWDRVNQSYMCEDYAVPNFLSLIYYSDFVVTDSFHGTAMSLLLEKPFYVFDRYKADNKMSMNSRLDTLIGYYHLPSVRVFSVDDMEINFEQKFNWNEIHEVTEELRKKGCAYLTMGLKEAE